MRLINHTFKIANIYHDDEDELVIELNDKNYDSLIINEQKTEIHVIEKIKEVDDESR